jgi:Protein of unknown function (DUF998)
VSKRINLLALLAIVGWTLFAASAVLLPIFSEYSFAGDYISELAIGSFGYVQTVAFFTAGLGALALALGIRETTRGSWGSRVGSAMVGLFGINVLLAGIFPTDAIDAEGQVLSPTIAGTVHIVVSLLAFLSIIAAMFVLSRTFKQNIRWRSFWPVSLVLAFAALVMFFLTSAGQWTGLYQRVFIGTLVLWLILAAIRLRSIARKSAPAGQA